MNNIFSGVRLLAALALVAGIATPALAETDVTDRLQIGAPALVLEGTLEHGNAARYVFTLRRGARVSAALSQTNHSDIILQLLRADGDPDKQLASLLTYRIEGRGQSQVRYAVVLRWHPHILYEVKPRPSPYRIELKLE